MFYVRLLLIAFWVASGAVVGTLWCLPRWGSLSLNRELAWVFSWGLRILSGIGVELEGREWLESRQPCVYVGNHQSMVDVITYSSIMPGRTIAIGKHELIWIPFFGILFVAAGNILIRRTDRRRAIATIHRAVEAIRRKKASIIIFPEGTRNPNSDEGLLPFKLGAFHMAIQAQVPIMPIVCAPVSRVFDRKRKRIKGGCLKLRVLPAIETAGLGPQDAEPLAAKVRERMMEAFRGLS